MQEKIYWVSAMIIAGAILSGSATASELRWVPGQGSTVPAGAIEGGVEHDGPDMPLCRTNKGNDPRTGKKLADKCNIAYNGTEDRANTFEILVGPSSEYSWQRINSLKPDDMVRMVVGSVDGRYAYACRARHKNQWQQGRGIHPGYMTGMQCKYGFGGREEVMDPSDGDLLYNSKFDVLYVKNNPLTPEQRAGIAAIMQDVEDRWLSPTRYIYLKPKTFPDREKDVENPTLFLAEYFFILRKLGIYDDPQIRAKHKAWAKTWVDGIRLAPGIFDRKPEDRQRNRDTWCVRHFSRDEQIGLMIMDWVFNRELGLGQELYQYGSNSPKVLGLWTYENRFWRTDGNHVDWLCDKGERVGHPESLGYGVRQPEFSALAKSAVGASIDTNGETGVAVALRFTEGRSPGCSSGKVMAYMRMEIFRASGNDLIQNALARFDNKMLDMYGPNPFASLMEVYFKHPEHPFRRLSAYLVRQDDYIWQPSEKEYPGC